MVICLSIFYQSFNFSAVLNTGAGISRAQSYRPMKDPHSPESRQESQLTIIKSLSQKLTFRVSCDANQLKIQVFEWVFNALFQRWFQF